MTSAAPAFPLVVKEVRTVARDPRTYVFRAAFAVLAVPILLQGWSQASSLPALAVSELAQVGRGVFFWVVALQAGVALFGAAAVGAGSVSGEVRRGTLPLLLMASMDGPRIVRAKLLAAVLQALNVLLCGAPLLAVAAFLGAAGPLEIAGATALALAAAAVGGAYGVDASARTPAGGSALLRAFGGLALYGLAAWLASFLTVGFATFALPFVHVYVALLVFLLPGAYLLPPSIFPFTVLAASTAFALWKIRRAGKLVALSAYRPVLAAESPRDLVGLDALYRRRRPGAWEDAPILWKELATRPVARLPLFGRLFGLVTLGALVLLGLFMADASAVGYFLFLWTIFLGLALTAGVLLFETERSQNQWETLLTTPLSRGSFLRQKLAAGLFAPESLCVAALAGVSALVWGGVAGPDALLCLLLVSAGFLGLAFVGGAAASLFCRSLPVAWGTAAFGAALLVWGVDGLPRPELAALSPWALMKEILFSARSGVSPFPRSGAALASYGALALGLYGLAFRRLQECPPRT